MEKSLRSSLHNRFICLDLWVLFVSKPTFFFGFWLIVGGVGGWASRGGPTPTPVSKIMVLPQNTSHNQSTWNLMCKGYNNQSFCVCVCVCHYKPKFDCTFNLAYTWAGAITYHIVWHYYIIVVCIASTQLAKGFCMIASASFWYKQ